MKWLEGQMLRYIGEILLNIDDHHMNEAEDRIKRTIEVNERNGTKILRECGADGWVEKYKEELAGLSGKNP